MKPARSPNTIQKLLIIHLLRFNINMITDSFFNTVKRLSKSQCQVAKSSLVNFPSLSVHLVSWWLLLVILNCTILLILRSKLSKWYRDETFTHYNT